MFEIPWYVFALLGAFFIALVSVTEKKILEHENPLHFSGSITLVVGLLSLPLLLLVDWSSVTPVSLLIMYVISLLALVAFYLTSICIRGLEAGELSVVLTLTPIVTAVFGFVFLGEALSEQAMLGLVLVVLGLIVLEAPKLWKTRNTKRFGKRLMYIAIAGVAIAVYSASAVLDRIVLKTGEIEPLHFLTIVQTFALINFSVFSLFRPVREKVLTHTFRKEPLKMTGIAILLFLSRLMYSHAVSLAYIALAAVLKRTGALFTIVLARSYLHEHGVGHKLLAASFVLAGVALVIL